MSACPSTLIAANTRNARKGSVSMPRSKGRFATPRRIKGKGLGIIYSIEDKNRQKAPRRAMVHLVEVLPG
jgi:hypothetical protein